MKKPFTALFKKLFTADYPYCIYCGKEAGADAELYCCPDCRTVIRPGDNLKIPGLQYAACYAFEGPVRNVIHRYKYNGEKYLDEKIAQIMKTRWAFDGSQLQGITHVPLHKNKRKKRGYDQSERIAKRLSELTGIPYIGTLTRTKDTVSQTHLTREERMQNVKGVFEVQADVKGLNLLLIDDVLTTGSTALECTRALIASGAVSVHVFVFAKAA